MIFYKQCGNCDECDFIFHVSMSAEKKSVALNTRKSGEWGLEESYNDLPIEIGKVFELLILSFEVEFVLVIDKIVFSTFVFRLEPNEANYLYLNSTNPGDELHILDIEMASNS